MQKKAQALSMNTIIIAALALLVLAIISLLFIGRMNSANTDINSCRRNGGTCVPEALGSCTDAIDGDSSLRIRYSLGRELSGYRCYTSGGDIEGDMMCCAFS